MRKDKALAALVDAVRHLGIIATGNDREPVRLECPRDDFPHRLLDVREALDEVDRASAAGHDAGDPVEVENLAMRRALAGIFLWLREEGLPEEKAREIAQEAAKRGVKKKKGATFSLRPKYAQSGKNKKFFSVKGVPDLDDRESISDIMKHGAKLARAKDSLGAGLVRPDMRGYERLQRELREMEDEKKNESRTVISPANYR